MQGTSGGRRRLRVFRKASTGDPVFRSELLRGVWQCRRHDVRRRNPHVLLPDPETFREESKVSIPGHQQTPDPARPPEQPWDEAEVNLLRKIPKMKNQAGYRLKEDFEAFEPPSTYYIQSENVL